MCKQYKTTYEYIEKMKKKYGIDIKLSVVGDGIMIEVVGNIKNVNHSKIAVKINKKLDIDAEAIGISKKDLIKLFF